MTALYLFCAAVGIPLLLWFSFAGDADGGDEYDASDGDGGDCVDCNAEDVGMVIVMMVAALTAATTVGMHLLVTMNSAMARITLQRLPVL